MRTSPEAYAQLLNHQRQVGQGKTQLTAVRARTEDEEQMALFAWVAANLRRYPELALLYHIPNGGKRSMSQAVRFKKMGVKAGIPDLHLPVARGGYHSLYIELKTQNGSLTPFQREQAIALAEAGNCWELARGWEHARNILVWYLAKEE